MNRRLLGTFSLFLTCMSIPLFAAGQQRRTDSLDALASLNVSEWPLMKMFLKNEFEQARQYLAQEVVQDIYCVAVDKENRSIFHGMLGESDIYQFYLDCKFGKRWPEEHSSIVVHGLDELFNRLFQKHSDVLRCRIKRTGVTVEQTIARRAPTLFVRLIEQQKQSFSTYRIRTELPVNLSKQVLERVEQEVRAYAQRKKVSYKKNEFLREYAHHHGRMDVYDWFGMDFEDRILLKLGEVPADRIRKVLNTIHARVGADRFRKMLAATTYEGKNVCANFLTAESKYAFVLEFIQGAMELVPDITPRELGFEWVRKDTLMSNDMKEIYYFKGETILHAFAKNMGYARSVQVAQDLFTLIHKLAGDSWQRMYQAQDCNGYSPYNYFLKLNQADREKFVSIGEVLDPENPILHCVQGGYESDSSNSSDSSFHSACSSVSAESSLFFSAHDPQEFVQEPNTAGTHGDHNVSGFETIGEPVAMQLDEDNETDHSESELDDHELCRASGQFATEEEPVRNPVDESKQQADDEALDGHVAGDIHKDETENEGDVRSVCSEHSSVQRDEDEPTPDNTQNEDEGKSAQDAARSNAVLSDIQAEKKDVVASMPTASTPSEKVTEQVADRRDQVEVTTDCVEPGTGEQLRTLEAGRRGTKQSDERSWLRSPGLWVGLTTAGVVAGAAAWKYRDRIQGGVKKLRTKFFGKQEPKEEEVREACAAAEDAK